MKYSFIGSGFISKILQAQLDDQFVVYDRSNIYKLHDTDHGSVIVCAPTGNRLKVNSDQSGDFSDCKTIVEQITKTKFDKLIYISTVDVFQNSHYGYNRKWLEDQLSKDKKSMIIRLPTLVHPSIRKNILFDLSQKKWLEKISLESRMQWYPLANLFDDIKKTIELGLSQNNLVSKPIPNKEIVLELEPDLFLNLSKNQVNSCHYDVKSQNGKYWVSDQDIWHSIKSCYSEMKKHIDNTA